MKLFPGKRCESDLSGQLIRIAAKDSEEVDYVAVYVVVRLDRTRRSVEQHSAGSAEWLAVAVGWRQQREQPSKVTELPTIPSKSDPPILPASDDSSRCTDRIDGVRIDKYGRDGILASVIHTMGLRSRHLGCTGYVPGYTG